MKNNYKFLSITTLLLSSIFIASISASTDTMNPEEMKSANFLAYKGVIKDHKNNYSNYRLGDTISRREMIKITMKLSGKEVENKCEGKFIDLPSSDYGCKYAEAALKYGFISANPKYRPNDNVTKTEALKMIFKAKGIEKSVKTEDWKKDYMTTAYDIGLIDSKYIDYNSDALRGWIFLTSSRTIEGRDDYFNKNYSDEFKF